MATYDDHLRLNGKRVGDFLLVLIELFSLGRTAEVLRAIIGTKSATSLQRGPVDPYFAFFADFHILVAKYVAVVECGPILSVKIVFQFQSSTFGHY